MNTPEFDFEALVRSMGMADIQSAVNAAAKKVAEEQEAARKAAEEAERKRREAEAEAARRIAEEKEREEKATRHVKKITAVANSALTHTLTADDVAYILRQYAQDKHPDFPAEDFEAIFDGDTIENYVEMTVAVFSNMKFLLPSGAHAPGKKEKPVTGAPSILNFDEAFKQLFPNHDAGMTGSCIPHKQEAPKTDDEVLRSFVNRILK